MVFSSPIFLFLFLPSVMAAYFLVRVPLRNLLLLIASLFFYAWGETVYVLLMLGAIVANYVFGIVVDRTEGTSKKIALVIALALNLGVLISFKYANFIVDNLNMALQVIGITPIMIGPVHLPIGISFFTFQAMSYVIDVYRREAPAQTNPVNIALYIALFPQLIAGPIVRYHDVAAQLLKRTIDIEGVSYGVRRFIIGLAKKVLVANFMGRIADDIFSLGPEALTTPVAWIGIIAYTLQIYFDFSGYSDMAIGLGRIFGFRFLENFNYPYISQSITEFWRRWHISLSSWYRDYLYIPLGGNRKGVFRTYLNLLIVFFLCGLWHGASWNFIIWGLYHGFFLVIERMGFGRILSQLWQPLRHLYLLLVVMLGWVFFRAETLEQSTTFVSALLGLHEPAGTSFNIWYFVANEDWLVLVIGIIGSTPAMARLLERSSEWQRQQSLAMNAAFRSVGFIMLYAMFALCALRLAAGTHNPFIYFRF